MQKTKSKLLCRSCDLVVQLPPYRKGFHCVCPQCHSQLRSGSKSTLENLAVVSIASVIMLFTSLTLPFMSISSYGISQSMSLTSIVTILSRDWSILLYLCILFTFFCPLVMHLIVIGVVFFRLQVTRRIANIYMFCHRFCMVDVFILGVVVSLVKLVALAKVDFHAGFYSAILFAMLMVWCYSRGSPYRIWNLLERNDTELRHAHIGMRGIDQGLIMCRHCGMVYKRRNRTLSASELNSLTSADDRYLYQGEVECPRCHHSNDYRAPSCYQKTIALLLAAVIIYVPSNVYPIMVTDYLGTATGSNIIDGVISLWQMNSYFVAMVIFIASICIPMLKILCILWLLYVSHYGFRRNPGRFNKLYRVILFIGRWSMIDVFVVIIMSTVVRMSGLLTISPGMAIIFFSFTVLLTMIAAEEYDERLLWDHALGTRPQTLLDDRGHVIADDNPASAAVSAAKTAAATATAAAASATAAAASAAVTAAGSAAQAASAAVLSPGQRQSLVRAWELLQGARGAADAQTSEPAAPAPESAQAAAESSGADRAPAATAAADRASSASRAADLAAAAASSTADKAARQGSDSKSDGHDKSNR